MIASPSQRKKFEVYVRSIVHGFDGTLASYINTKLPTLTAFIAGKRKLV
jgi:hypothetical protein